MLEVVMGRRWTFAWSLTVGCFLLLGACTNPKPPTPEPTPTPVPTPVPTPTPVAECTLEGDPTIAVDHPNTLGMKVNEAMHRLRPDCDVGGTCLLGDQTQQEWQAAVEAELRRMGLCAGQHAPSTDEIAVAVEAKDPWQGFQIFAGNDGSGPVPPGGARRTVRWSPYGFKGAWLPPAAAPPGTPPPPQPPVAGCSSPVTPKVDRFNLNAHNRWIDSTPLFYNRETLRWDGTMITGYCDAAGFTNRLHCPARSECPGYKCEERVACETLGVGGKPLWRCESGEPTINPENPYQAGCGGAWIEVCAADGTGCSRKAL